MKPISLQLYSVRDACAVDFPGTCKKVADIGYTGVELAGLHGMTAAAAKAMLDDLGLKISSQHGPLPTKENVEQLVADCKTFGISQTVTGFGPDDMKTVDATKACAAKMQAGAELLKGTGIELCYHNHWWEFEPLEGQFAFDVLMAEAPDLRAQLDTYWCTFGGADAPAVLKRYGKRIPLLHIKDGPLVPGQPHPHTAVGKGKMDFPTVIAAADPDVCKWLIVELDSCATDMVEAVADSYKYLVGSGLASGNK